MALGINLTIRGTSAVNAATTGSSSSLVVEQTAGARELTDWTHRYRFEKGRVRVIGTDVTQFDRATGATVATSTNELTGVTITTVQDGEAQSPKSTTTRKSPRFLTVESVNIGA